MIRRSFFFKNIFKSWSNLNSNMQTKLISATSRPFSILLIPGFEFCARNWKFAKRNVWWYYINAMMLFFKHVEESFSAISYHIHYSSKYSLSLFFFTNLKLETWTLHIAGYRNLLKNPQHDELEPNLKKIPHRNRIWGLEAIVMFFHLTISKKSDSVAHVRKITEPRFWKWNHITNEFFSIINEKDL